MIREDRELLAELARLNTAMAPLAMRIMDGSASRNEQQDYAQRLITAGKRLQARASKTNDVVIEAGFSRVFRLCFQRKPQSLIWNREQRSTDPTPLAHRRA